MDIHHPLQLLGGLSAATFMRRHWQKKPLLVRQALPGFSALLSRAQLFSLAASEEVESRLVQHSTAAKSAKSTNSAKASGWQMARGPFSRRALPPLNRPNWSLLVQGVDLHDDRIRALLDRFRFVPDARLDDVMISYATNGGGVGPHFDSYDVFLLQAHGTRRWRIGRQKDLSLVDGAPLKVLRQFEPEQTFDLEPGDMLYLPPRYAHDGVAMGECMTYSIGFRAPTLAELKRELLQRMADAGDPAQSTRHYQDKNQGATANPAEVPGDLLQFSELAVGFPSAKSSNISSEIELALGEYLTEPKANVWFVPPAQPRSSLPAGRLQLDRRTRMMYAGAQLFVNGESFTVAGRDAAILRGLADSRIIEATSVSRLSGAAKGALLDWFNAGWIDG